MKKEVFLAILAGITAGLILAFGVWKISKVYKNEEISPNSVSTQSPSPEPGENASFFSLASPNDLDVITQNPVIIKGVASNDIYLLIISDEKDYIVNINEDQSFNQEVELSGGINLLKIEGFRKKENVGSKQISLIYSTEFSESDEEKSGDSGEESSKKDAQDKSIRDKVQEKIDETIKRATAYLGTVTDISNESIQIRSENNGIQQIATDSETTTAPKGQVAIGDFIAAMGYTNGNKVLDAKRILITKQPQNNYNAYYLTVASIKGKEVKTVDAQNKEYLLKFPKTWQGPEISELEEGMEIIVVGTLNDQTLDLRSIFEIEE